MKITTKINLIAAVWIFLVLLVVNSIVFFSFMKITFNMEHDDLHQKAQNIIKEINLEDSSAAIEEQLTLSLNSHSFIRIMDKDSNVVNTVTNDPDLALRVKAQFSSKPKTQRFTIKQENGEKQIIVLTVPIKANGHVVGGLQIGERILGLELGKDVLLLILAISTILGVVLSLLGGRGLSNLMMRPISNMINTMEDIEKSGVPKKIVIQHETKDELQKMAVTFNRMINRLDKNIDKQKQFISDASHELKTPLTVIKSYADLLRRRGIENEKMTWEAIETIYSEATRMQKMTERFLELANTELENHMEFKNINAVTLCENIIHQLKETYKRLITLHYKGPAISIWGDELKLKQVIIIILDNAIKYSTEKIDVFLEEKENFTEIVVKDSGIGIPDSELEHIFERFYRVDKARSRETGGTGLGLAIANNIIKQHNGEINVRSKDGAGTEVELLIPNRNQDEPNSKS